MSGTKGVQVRRAKAVVRLVVASSLVLSVLPVGGCSAKTDDPEAVERKRTQEALGISVTDVSGSLSRIQFDCLKESPTHWVIKGSRPVSGSIPKAHYEMRPRVNVKGPEGEEVVGILTEYSGLSVARGSRDPSKEASRHHFGGGGYNPLHVYIGHLNGTVVSPFLFFPDVGSHNTAPFHLGFDAEGACHLLIADVDIYQDNRLKVYWLIGDPVTGKWVKAWIVDRRDFTSSSHVWVVRLGDEVHALWSWDAGRASSDSGIYHLKRSASAFGPISQVAKGRFTGVDVAVDDMSESMMLAFCNDRTYFVCRFSSKRGWGRPEALHLGNKVAGSVLLDYEGGGAYILRADALEQKEWVIKEEQPN